MRRLRLRNLNERSELPRGTRDPSLCLSLQPAFQAFLGPTSAHTRRLPSAPRLGSPEEFVASPMCEAGPLSVEEK